MKKYLFFTIVFLLFFLFFITNSSFGYYDGIVTYNNVRIDISQINKDDPTSPNVGYILMYNKYDSRYELLHFFGNGCTGDTSDIFYRVINENNNTITFHGIPSFRNYTIQEILISDGSYDIVGLISTAYYPNGYTLSLDKYDFICSNVLIYTNSSATTLATDFFQSSEIDNNYNYDDYVLPELPDNLYKYNYITTTVLPYGAYYYVLMSSSQPLEFYQGVCSSCQEEHYSASDCSGEGILDCCSHMLSSGYIKYYVYKPDDYPSKDEYSGNSLWSLNTSFSGFYTNYKQHMHKQTNPDLFYRERIVYSDYAITFKTVSGQVYEVLEPNNYNDFKNHVITNGSDYVVNENYYNNQPSLDEEEEGFWEKLFKFLFVPKERIF